MTYYQHVIPHGMPDPWFVFQPPPFLSLVFWLYCTAKLHHFFHFPGAVIWELASMRCFPPRNTFFMFPAWLQTLPDHTNLTAVYGLW